MRQRGLELLMVLMGLMLAFVVHAQPTVFAGLSNNKAMIGDQVNLHLEAVYPEDHQVTNVDLSVLDSVFAQVDPSKGTTPGLMEILSQTEWETLNNSGSITYRKDVKLICWESGIYRIPQVRFSFESKGTNFTRATNQLVLQIASPIGEQEIVDTIQIAPIKGIDREEWQLSDLMPVLYFLVGLVLGLISLVALIFYIVKKREGPPPLKVIQRPAHEIAIQKLKDLKAAELWQKGEVKTYQSQLTYIIREYIENRYDTPALESTTRKILSDLKAANFPDNLVAKMQEMLQLADMVKFAKATPPEEMHSRLMIYAEEIVGQTKQTVTEVEAARIKAEGAGTQKTFVLTIDYAHPGRRLLAAMLDLIFFQVFHGFFYFIIILIVGLTGNALSPLYLVIISVCLFLVIGYVYYVFMHVNSGQTFGKKILGLQLTNYEGKKLSGGRAFIRFIVKFVSLILFWLPFLPLLFNTRKQGLHDMVANSIVIKKIKQQ